MNKRLINRALDLKRILPSISDSEICELDLKLAYNIGCSSSEVSDELVDEIQNLVSQEEIYTKPEDIDSAVNQVIHIYASNNFGYTMQNNLFGALALVVAIENMVLRLMNLQAMWYDGISTGIYLFTLLVWVIIVSNKHFMNRKVFVVLNKINLISGALSVIVLMFFYLALFMAEILGCEKHTILTIGILMITLLLAYIIYLIVLALINVKKYKIDKSIDNK